jgi:hypothetical protein
MHDLSDKKRMEIANICYANISHWFAAMCNPANRGAKFEWKNFPAMMESRSLDWRLIHNVRGNKDSIDLYMAQCTREITARMLDASELAK